MTNITRKNTDQTLQVGKQIVETIIALTRQINKDKISSQVAGHITDVLGVGTRLVQAIKLKNEPDTQAICEGLRPKIHEPVDIVVTLDVLIEHMQLLTQELTATGMVADGASAKSLSVIMQSNQKVLSIIGARIKCHEHAQASEAIKDNYLKVACFQQKELINYWHELMMMYQHGQRHLADIHSPEALSKERHAMKPIKLTLAARIQHVTDTLVMAESYIISKTSEQSHPMHGVISSLSTAIDQEFKGLQQVCDAMLKWSNDTYGEHGRRTAIEGLLTLSQARQTLEVAMIHAGIDASVHQEAVIAIHALNNTLKKMAKAVQSIEIPKSVSGRRKDAVIAVFNAPKMGGQGFEAIAGQEPAKTQLNSIYQQGSNKVCQTENKLEEKFMRLCQYLKITMPNGQATA